MKLRVAPEPFTRGENGYSPGIFGLPSPYWRKNLPDQHWADKFLEGTYLSALSWRLPGQEWLVWQSSPALGWVLLSPDGERSYHRTQKDAQRWAHHLQEQAPKIS